MISSFPVGDWFWTSYVVIGNGNVVVDFKGLCYGDVDGSYLPPAKREPTIFLENQVSKLLITNSSWILSGDPAHEYELFPCPDYPEKELESSA